MLDKNGEIIYIGKSISLKSRVSSYFTRSKKTPKVEKMVYFISNVDYIITDTHLEARLLECSLIKEIRPHFNSQFKRTRRAFYLKINIDKGNNALQIVSGKEVNCFGPFSSRRPLENFIENIAHFFPISKDKNNYNFFYHPLPETSNTHLLKINNEIIKDLFLNSNEMKNFIITLEDLMKEESAHFHYERASICRDLIKSLNYIYHIIFDFQNFLNSDLLLKIPLEDGYKLFFVSQGQIILKQSYPELNLRILNSFKKKGERLKPSITSFSNENLDLDFISILYSEIRDMPEEWKNY